MPVADESNRKLQLLEPDDFDEAELTLSRSWFVQVVRGVVWLGWYIFLGALLIVLVLIAVYQTDAMTLNITAQITGQGNMSSSYAGDWLNVSLLQNANGLNISVVGGAA